MRLRADSVRRVLIETLGRRRFPFNRQGAQSAREESVRDHGQGIRSLALEGAKPRGAASARRANRVVGRQGLSEGAKPRSRGLPGRSVAFVQPVNR